MPASSLYQHLQREFSALTQSRRNQNYIKSHGPPPLPPSESESESGTGTHQGGTGAASDDFARNTTCTVQLVSFQAELYPMLQPTLFDLRHLPKVRYKSRLNGNDAFIDRLPLHYVNVNANLLDTSDHKNLGENVISAPYCRVFLVTIEDGLDEYRNIVRPMLKDWVAKREQMKEQYLILLLQPYEASIKKTNGDADLDGGTNGTNSVSRSSSTQSNGDVPTGTGLKATLARVRNNIVSGTNEPADGSSNSKVQRSQSSDQIFRKLSYDFGSSKAALLSFKKDNVVASQMAFEKFRNQLAGCIVSTYEERVRSLEENLRSIQSQRIEEKGAAWDFAAFFLGKEKLAYTFEQMRMEKDALLQYEELEAFVHIEQNLPKKVNNSEVLSDDVAQELQIRDFLQRLRLNQVTDQELYQRLFERQSHFHLLSKRMIDALVFARKFIVSSYKRFIDDGDARGISLADAERFAFQSCYELHYLCETLLFNSDNVDLFTPDEISKVSIFLRSILEFGRRRLLHCAKESSLTCDAVVSIIGIYSHRTLRSWLPWKDIESSEDVHLDLSYCEQWPIARDKQWSMNCFTFPKNMEEAYLHVGLEMLRHSKTSDSRRQTLRLQQECAEIYMSRNAFNQALELLSGSMRDLEWQRLLGWLLFRYACCQRVLARRDDEIFKEYLATLIRCFCVTTEVSALDLLLDDLQSMVESSDSDIGALAFPFPDVQIRVCPTSEGKRWVHVSTPENHRQKTSLHIAEVGEMINIECSFVSFFPRDVKVEKLILSLQNIPTSNEAAANQDNIQLVLKDVTIVKGKNLFTFKIQPKISIETCKIMNLGMKWGSALFVADFDRLSSKHHALQILQSTPTQKLDIKPMPFIIPTGNIQKVICQYKSGKDFVEEGIIECSCSEGLEIFTSEIDAFHNDDTNIDWAKSRQRSISKCEPGETKDYYIFLRVTSKEDNKDAFQEVNVSIKSKFLHALHNDVGQDHSNATIEDKDSAFMDCHLEASVKSQICRALVVESCELFDVDDDGTKMLCFEMYSQASVSFHLSQWKLNVHGVDCEVVDNNKDLFQREVVPHENVNFVYTLKAMKQDSISCNFCVQLVDEFDQKHTQEVELSVDKDSMNASNTSGGIYGETFNMDNDPSISNVSLSLESPLRKGPIGAPVPFIYHIDATSLSPEVKLKYVLDFGSFESNRDWIVSGKINGNIISGSMTALSFVGIPTRAGVLTSFPSVFIENPSIDSKNGKSFRKEFKMSTSFLSIPHYSNVAHALLVDEELVL